MCYDIKKFEKLLKYKLNFKNSNNRLNKVSKFLFNNNLEKKSPEIIINNLLR